jgi:hypothetical protein
MVEHKPGDKVVDQTTEHKQTADGAIVEARAGQPELVKSQKAVIADLKAGGRSGITNEFGKPAFFDSHEKGAPQEVAQVTMKEYHEWELKLKPNEFAQAPDGGLVHADDHGRINRIRDLKGNTTVIDYVGDTDQPSSIKIGGGETLTWHGGYYGIAGEEGQISAHVDQHSGVIKWSNRHGDETRHFPSGGTLNEDSRGRITSIVDAYNQKAVFTYDQRSGDYPSHIELGFDTGKPIREFDIVGNGSRPEYYFSGNADFGGGNRMAIAPDRNTGQIYMMSLPDNNAIDAYQELPTVKVHRLNGKNDTLIEGDTNFLPEPLRILINGTAKV